MLVELKEVKEKLKVADSKVVKYLNDLFDTLSSDEGSGVAKGLKFEVDGIWYGTIQLESEEVSDEGKYQYGAENYQIVSFDKSKKSYPCDKSIINRFNLFVCESWCRSGSYYSDYCHMYDIPILFTYDIVTVPKVVIPEHEESKYKGL